MSTQPAGLPSPLRAVPLALFPTMGSLQEVVDIADAKLPIVNKNEVISLLMIMLNTVLAQLDRERHEK